MTGCDMHRREAYIEAKVCNYAHNRGWRQRKVQYIGRRGCPDRWFMRPNGQLVIIEFKDPNGKLSAHQRREINWLRQAGFNVHIIDSIEAGRAVFDEFEDDGATEDPSDDEIA